MSLTLTEQTTLASLFNGSHTQKLLPFYYNMSDEFLSCLEGTLNVSVKSFGGVKRICIFFRKMSMLHEQLTSICITNVACFCSSSNYSNLYCNILMGVLRYDQNVLFQ